MITNKRILTIQDISCVGQCSITVAQPILSACGIETCILPSAVLSNHTGGFKDFFFRDLTDDIPKIREHWEKEGILFGAVLTGYLGNAAQISMVKDIMNSCLLPGGLRIVDPAMADHGKLYRGFDQAHVTAMGELCKCADILLPNLTEACFLTGTEYMEGEVEESYVRDLLEKLSDFGARRVILKGISFEEGKLGNAVYDAETDQVRFYFTDRFAKSSHGTGDCFAAAFTGALLQGSSAYNAAVLASDFVVESLMQTADDPDHWYGVKFEQALPMLVRRLNRAEPVSRKAREAAQERVIYRLDGSSFKDASGFYQEIARLMTDGATETGGNLDALNDILRGGFGKHHYGEPIEIIWENFSDSREALGESLTFRIVNVILNADDDHDCLLRISE
ncbi:MAG: pyridoxamine kinase [Stomatobaculum sp.]|nr:pyridoxamine kinase [Stomatobaculum sp.]